MTACPCCGGALVRASRLPDDLGAMRSGDRWCPTCEWRIAREEVEVPGLRGPCPRHNG